MRPPAPTVFLSLFSLLHTVYSYNNPLACTGTCTNTHDPSLILSPSGTYYRFSTGSKIAIHTSPSLTGPWTYRGAALPSGSSINKPGNTDLWAPDVQKIGDTYYLYYSVSTFGSQNSAIGFATSKTLEVGSWSDGGSTGVASDSGKPYNAIDGNLFSEGGNLFMTFGSFWGDIYQVKMTDPPKKVASGSTSTQVAYTPSGTHAQEGAYLYKYGSWYYLFYSAGICCGFDNSRPAAGQEYKIKVCRSSSATGDFVDKSGVACKSGGGTTVLESHGWVYGPGGQGVFNDPSLGPVLYYHYVDTRIGYADGQKQLGINKIDFSSGWPVV